MGCYTITYDKAGNISTIQNSLASETQAFGYDTLDRLTSASATGTYAYSESYAYDSTTGNLAARSSGAYTPPAPNPGTTGLVAWWSMNETSGTRYDSHGTNHLTDVNTVASAAGLKGNAASFAPNQQEQLTIADNASVSVGDIDFTIVANVYLNNTTDMSAVLAKGVDSSNNDYRIAYNPSTGFRFRVGPSSGTAYVDSGPVAANTWYTIVAWHDSVNNTINIQLNNGTVQTQSYSGGATDSTAAFSIGAYADRTWELNGKVDEVALYKRVLTAAERGWLYNSGQGRTYAEVNPLPPSALNYTYGDAAHAHAVTGLGGNTYTYDANGNMTCRVEGGVTYKQAYNADNQLVTVSKMNGTCATGTVLETTNLVYDGDGQRVAQTVGTVTTYFVGNYYEITGSQVTQYYYAGTQRVAMRKYTVPQPMTVEYFLTDHLGSTGITTDSSGNKVSEIRYKAWGEIRYSWKSGVSTTPSYKLPSYTYTGQFSYMDDPTTTGTTEGFGLMFYNARFYSPYINHFIQPDSIVPGYGKPQALNRYAYTLNNPLRYTDPTGHMVACEDGDICVHDYPGPKTGGNGGGGGGGGHHDDEDLPDSNPDGLIAPISPTPVPDIPRYDPIAIYCGASSSLGCLSFVLQDGATMVDIVGMGVVSAFTITGCIVGTPGGGGGILAGCAAGGAEGLFFYNTSGLNFAESVLSVGSSVLTGIDDYQNYGELGESSQTSIPATLTGLVMIDPFTDAIIDGYVSGYNHGLFNGIDNIYNGQPILVP